MDVSATFLGVGSSRSPSGWWLRANADGLLRSGMGSSAASKNSAYVGSFWLGILKASSGRSHQNTSLESLTCAMRLS